MEILKLESNSTLRKIKDIIAQDLKQIMTIDEIQDFIDNLHDYSIDSSMLNMMYIDKLINDCTHVSLEHAMLACGRFQRSLEYLIFEEIQRSMQKNFDDLVERWYDKNQFSITDIRTEILRIKNI